MSDNVLKLADRGAPKVDQELVDRLEDLLEMARTGDLQSFWGAGSTANGDMVTTCGPTPNIWTDLGGVELLKKRMLEEYCDA